VPSNPPPTTTEFLGSAPFAAERSGTEEECQQAGAIRKKEKEDDQKEREREREETDRQHKEGALMKSGHTAETEKRALVGPCPRAPHSRP